QIYYHQGGHGGPPPLTMMNRWFTRYLYGIDNGAEQDPKAWIVREGDKMDQPTAYPDYPNPEATDLVLHLVKGAPEWGGLVTQKPNKQGIETLVDNYSFSGSALAQAEITRHRLLYVTPPLAKEVHISGVPKNKVRLASNKTAANLSVYLVSLPWNNGRNARITDNLINRAWADPQNHSSLTHGTPLVPGKFYDMEFELNPDDQIIPAGQQIGLLIFSSDREFTILPEPGTQLSVDLDGTQLTLTVVGVMIVTRYPQPTMVSMPGGSWSKQPVRLYLLLCARRTPCGTVVLLNVTQRPQLGSTKTLEPSLLNVCISPPTPF